MPSASFSARLQMLHARWGDREQSVDQLDVDFRRGRAIAYSSPLFFLSFFSIGLLVFRLSSSFFPLCSVLFVLTR